MAFPQPTMRDALVRHKPFLVCVTQEHANTKSSSWPEVTVQVWNAFNIDTLNESYGHVIDKSLMSHLVDKVPSTNKLQGLTINDDGGPRNIIAWNDETVMSLVNNAKTIMGLHIGAAVQHTYTNADGTFNAKILGLNNKTTVDHVIELGNSRRDTLVVGLGRTSAKWMGSVLLKGYNSVTKESQWPLRQLANLCDHAQTRYGYIQTDKELVACYFNDEEQLEESEEIHLTANIMSVPWNTDLSSGQMSAPKTHLTTELALWWLCMLSLCDDHRPIVKADKVVSIDAWATLPRDDGSGWVRRHRYSGFEVLTNTPPPAFFNGAGLSGGHLPSFDSPFAFDFLLPQGGNENAVTYLGETNPEM